MHDGAAWHGWQLGLQWPGVVWTSIGMARSGMGHHGMAWRGLSGTEWYGVVCSRAEQYRGLQSGVE